MSVKRRRRFNPNLRFRYNGSFMSESKTDRQFTGNNLIDNYQISADINKADIFNQSNVVIAEYNNGRRVYFEPCPNRMVHKVSKKFYKMRRRQMRAEGW
jgi:hypothetical protein